MGTTGDIAMTEVTTVVVTDPMITGNAAELPTPEKKRPNRSRIATGSAFGI